MNTTRRPACTRANRCRTLLLFGISSVAIVSTASAQHIDIRWDPSGDLRIYGTDLPDEIRVFVENGYLRFHFRTQGGTVPWWASPANSDYANYWVPRVFVTKMIFYGYAGKDTFVRPWQDRSLDMPRVELYGGAGDDTLWGSPYNDFIQGETGNDTIFGFGGSDVLFGDVGGDSIYGGSGNDFLCGGSDSDTLHGDNGADWIFKDSSDGVHFGNGPGDRGFDEPCSYAPVFISGYWVPGEGRNYGLFFADRGMFVLPGADVPFFEFGLFGDQPVIGDWDGNGVDDAGVVRNGLLYRDILPRGYQGNDPREYTGIPY